MTYNWYQYYCFGCSYGTNTKDDYCSKCGKIMFYHSNKKQ